MQETLAKVRIGRTLDAERVRGAVESLTESVLRNPDAMLLFSQLREKGEYAVSHSLDVSIYMTAFGRFLQLEHAQIELLGYLGLLQDIGKVRLPKALLEKRGRLDARGVRAGEAARQLFGRDPARHAGIPLELPRLATLHHERHDGSGYPNRLQGNHIGMIGSIAAIVDTFDAMTVQRPYADAVAPSAAISSLYKWRGVLVTTREHGRAVHPLHRHLPGRQPGRAEQRRGRRRDLAEPGAAAEAARDGDPRREGLRAAAAEAARPVALAEGDRGRALPHPAHARAGPRAGVERTALHEVRLRLFW